jgi:hypothetical protein
MPETSAAKLLLWQKQREKRRKHALAQELRRKPMNIRPGGNPLTVAAAYETDQPVWAPTVVAGTPVPKHVPRNTHRVGSIAWSFFYRYLLPGA